MRRKDAVSLQARVQEHSAFHPTVRADAERAIAMMGSRASAWVPTATLLHLGEWLNWPEWLRDGTSLVDTNGPLPAIISRADDIRIMANIVENADVVALVEMMLRRPRPALSLVGELAVLHGPDLGSSVRMVARSLAARNIWIHVDVAEQDQELEIALRPVWPMGELFSAFALCALTLLQRAVVSYRGDSLDGMRIITQVHDLPQAQKALAAFHCAIDPGNGSEALRFPQTWLRQTNPHFDPLVWDVAKARITALENDAGADEVVDPFREFIVDHLSRLHRVPRLKQAAAHFGISTRTIVRTLERRSTSYHQLVETERKARALALIADTSLSLAEVANMLGFSDMSSFGRSFRIWFGDTPGRLRRTATGRSGLASVGALDDSA